MSRVLIVGVTGIRDFPRLLDAILATRLPDAEYTIVHTGLLAEAARKGGPNAFRESKAWVTGRQLWQQAQASGVGFPVLLGDAKDCSRLEYWGLVSGVEIKGEATCFTLDRVRPLPGSGTPRELVLRKTGQHIAPNFIRPYAICGTPAFLCELDAEQLS